MKTLMLVACVACVAASVVVGTSDGESSPIAERRAKVAAGPNANAVLSLDIDASDKKMNDGNTSGTVAGAGTDVVVEVFITGLAGPILGGQFSIDTDMLTVQSAAATPGLAVLGTAEKTVSFGGFPPGVTLPNGYLGTVTLTTASDVTNMAFTVSASMNVADGTNIGETDLLTVAPLSFNTTPPRPHLTADFDGDGIVGFSDFLPFAGQYGARRGDGRYQAKYDLNSDGAIDFFDFLSFARSYGNTVPPSGGGGGGGDGGTPKMYWTDEYPQKIQRANLDGSQAEDLITTGLSDPFGIVLDVERGKMYWADRRPAKIQRANLDGSQAEDLITTGLRSPWGIALDVRGR